MLQIGSLVDGKYKILSEIGHGGMSVVYMAINEKANKTWAVKEVRKDGVLDFEAVKQGLVVETDMLKKLKHSNLPSIVDVIEDDETFLIVMDYIEGNSLSKSLEEFGAQPQEYVISWAKQLCDVLGYLHTREPAIIYRDMKPANVMLKPDGNLMLIDFGTAREFKAKNLADTTCLGTVGYAAPEQFGGMGQTDARTDIYCLGATLYHLVTGCNPSEPPYEIKPIRQINPSLSSGLERIIQKCTQRNPDDRYQSAAELMYALEHYEEIDDKYRKKQKRKLGSFIATVVGAMIFGAAGLVTANMATEMASDNYENKFSEASKEDDYDTKIKLYKECIAIPNMAGDIRAYEGIIDVYKDNDGVFSKEEFAEIRKLIEENRTDLEKDEAVYRELCFEVGKLYWYYYDFGNGEDSQITRAINCVEWFNLALDGASEGDEHYGMANAYSGIGEFYKNIAKYVVEAEDKGHYAPLIENLSILLDTVASNKDESVIVRLELLELARNAIRTYATNFKGDGVSMETMEEMLDQIENNLNEIETTTEQTTAKKNETLSQLEETRKAVENAFGTGKGGNE